MRVKSGAVLKEGPRLAFQSLRFCCLTSGCPAASHDDPLPSAS
jgi:hypothetical protein